MDFKKLAEIQGQKVVDSNKQTPAEKKQAIIDALKKKRAEQAKKKAIADSKKYVTFKVTDGYKNLKKKIKDDLDETESTEAAIETALAEITPEAPAEQVLAAVIEVLGDTIDQLEEDIIPDESVDEPAE